VAGELSWVLEPRESLRAWVSLAESLKADPRVKEAAEQGERALGEHHVALADVLAAAVDRVRDAVRNVTKLIGQTPIEGVVERHLIEQRAFVRRAVWSDQRLAAHLTARGARWAVPAYFVTAAAHEAP